MLYIGDKTPERCYFNGKRVSGIYSGEILLWPPVYTVTVSIDPSGAGTVTGAGQYKEGESVTIRAVPGDGYKFTGWRENGVAVSTNEAYTFTVTGNRTLTAAFELFVFTWIESPSTVVSRISVAYGNGKFVAVGINTTNTASYSTDGINWSTSTLPSSTNWRTIAYGNGKFVAIPQSFGKAAISTNGITWSSSTDTVSGPTITYGNGKFVVPGTHPKYSTDGNTWTYGNDLPYTFNCHGATYGGGKFVAVSYNNRYAAYSSDGISWTLSTLPSTAYWESVTYGNGRYVAVASGDSAGVKTVAYSDDGITWKSLSLPVLNNWKSVTYGNGRFVAVGYLNENTCYSEDGINWTLVKAPRKYSYGVVYGENKFVCVGSGKFIYAKG